MRNDPPIKAEIRSFIRRLEHDAAVAEAGLKTRRPALMAGASCAIDGPTLDGLAAWADLILHSALEGLVMGWSGDRVAFLIAEERAYRIASALDAALEGVEAHDAAAVVAGLRKAEGEAAREGPWG